jgi:hypothetical protein
MNFPLGYAELPQVLADDHTPKGLSFQHCMITALDPGGIACRISVMAFRMKRGHALSPPPGLLRSLRTARAQSASRTAASAGAAPRRLILANARSQAP